MRACLVLLVLVMLRAPEADAQVCTPPPPGMSASLGEEWVATQPLDPVAARARQLVLHPAYDSVRVDTTTGLEIRAFIRDWPDVPVFRQWRDLPYPGVRIRVRVTLAGEWAKVETEVSLVCAPGFVPPPEWGQDLDVAHFVLHHTQNSYTNPLRRQPDRTRSAVAPQSCAGLSEGDPKIEICRDIARRRPDDADAQLQYALSLIRFFRGDRAQGPIRRLFTLTGDRLDLYVGLGAAFLDAFRFGDAERLARRAAELWPDSAVAHVQLGLSLTRQGKEERARPALERAIELGSADPDAFYGEALALAMARDSTGARRHFERALARYRETLPARAGSAWTWAALGRTASELGLHVDAVSYFTRAQLVDPALFRRERAFEAAIRRSFEAAGPQPPAPVPSSP